MSKMTPEQLAEMQRMAASMPPDMMQRAMAQMGSATPDQLAQMQRMTAGLTGEQLTSQAAASMGAASAAGRQQADSAAAALKAEGNRLHGLRQFSEAAEKYRLALDSLQGGARRSVRLPFLHALGGAACVPKRWDGWYHHTQLPLHNRRRSPARPRCRPGQPPGTRAAHQLPVQPGFLPPAAGTVAGVRGCLRRRAGGGPQQPQGALPQG
jgi:hypothetical protein